MKKRSVKRRAEKKLTKKTENAVDALMLHRRILHATARRRGGELRVNLSELNEIDASIDVHGNVLVFKVRRPLQARRKRRVGMMVAAFFVFVGIAVLAGVANAQSIKWADDFEHPRLGSNGLLVGSQACVGEVNFRDPEACVAMTYVHIRRARQQGTSLAYMAGRYSQALYRPRTARLWVLGLNGGGNRPARWRWASWGRARPMWMQYQALVAAVWAGTVPDPCPGAMHYGSKRLDANLDDRPGWNTAKCLPNSGQRFYVPVPS